MPTYDYRCKACGKTTEIFHSISEAPKKKCPHCKKSALERQIGAGAGILFKGTGFYQTDYRSDSYQKAAKAESGTTETKSEKSETSSSEPKAAATESKSSGTSETPKKSGGKSAGSAKKSGGSKKSE